MKKSKLKNKRFFKTKSLNNKRKIIKVIAYTFLLLVIIILFFKIKEIIYSNGVSYENTTDSKLYQSKDVQLNCVIQEEQNAATITNYVDLILGEKNRGFKIYNKMIIKYKMKLSDEMYKEYIKNLNSTKCIDEKSCTESNLKLGNTSLGKNTKLQRKKKKIIVTFYNTPEEKIKNKDKYLENIKKLYEEKGYSCK